MVYRILLVKEAYSTLKNLFITVIIHKSINKSIDSVQHNLRNVHNVIKKTHFISNLSINTSSMYFSYLQIQK
jgi:hypothetical protein